MKFVEVNYLEIEPNKEYENLIESVVQKCFEIENLLSKKIYLSVTLTVPVQIKKINSEYRNIDKETDVLSFPMFEKSEIDLISEEIEEVLGDIVISIPRVEEQAKEYGHSFERELAYMVVHGFYHIIGYDHIAEEDKQEMRECEEKVLNALEIKREI